MLRWAAAATVLLAVLTALNRREDCSLPRVSKLRTFVEGNSSSPHAFLFVHGYPDDHRMWDKTVAPLQQHHLVRVDLPDFDGSCSSPWGYDFPEVLRLLEQEAVLLQGKKVTLVTHDWGAWLGMMLHRDRPDLFQRVVSVDVGDPNWSLTFRLLQSTYQGYLISAWFVGGFIGEGMNTLFTKVLSMPSHATSLAPSKNYLYYYKWVHMEEFKEKLHTYAPTCPYLYVYSRYKIRLAKALTKYAPEPLKGWLADASEALQFHSDAWLDRVRSSHGLSRVVPFAEREVPMMGGSHWPMLDDAEQFNNILADFLAATDTP